MTIVNLIINTEIFLIQGGAAVAISFIYLINETYGMIKKQNLPSKICIICERPFTWRKKWQKVWDEVKYCSQKCKKFKVKEIENR